MALLLNMISHLIFILRYHIHISYEKYHYFIYFCVFTYDLTCIWFHMYMKSYVLAMRFHEISYVSSRLPGPVQKRSLAGSKAALILFKCTARPLRLSVLFGFEITLQWLQLFSIACSCGSTSGVLACGMYPWRIGISSWSGRLLPNGAQGVHLSCRVPRASSAPRDHWLSCRLEPFPASIATATATGRIGRVCDSITRRGEGMGSLKWGRTAAQQQRFRQGTANGRQYTRRCWRPLSPSSWRPPLAGIQVRGLT